MLGLFILLAVHGSHANFNCPPLIEPCQCWDYPSMKVRCDDVSSLDTVRLTLEDHFSGQLLPRLHFRGVNSLSLPPRFLGSLSTIRFFLSDSNIRHIDKEAFADQDKLALLVLNEDRLQDIPIEALKPLTGLQTLGMAGNFLMRIRKGSLDYLSSLRFLVLSNNRISVIDRHAFPSYLEILTLSRNLLSTLNNSLHHLDNLEEFSATDNRLTSVRNEFSGLQHLKRLYLERNQLTDISDSFAGLEFLTDLSLSDNRIRNIGKALTDLTSLRLLNVSRNYIVDIHWKSLESLKELRVLDISGNYLKTVCSALRPLRSLRDLNLSDLNLKVLESDCFYSMKSLSRLYLSHNWLTNVDAVSRSSLPVLTNLYLDHNRINAFRYDFNSAKKLKQLDISFNNLSSFKTHLLAFNKDLETFKMEGNPWKCSESVLLMMRDLEQRKVEVVGRPDC